MNKTHSTRGYTLIELLVALAIGLFVFGLVAEVFKKGMDVTSLVTRRTEMQQDARMAYNLIARDISMAGAGLPSGGVQLPSGNGATPSVFACDGVNCYIANNVYPNNNHLYAIIPGRFSGLPMDAAGARTDAITLAYVDLSYQLNQYPLLALTANSLTVDPLTTPPITDPGKGLKAGDLLLLQNNVGTAVVEVTNVAGNNLTFIAPDSLNVNQPGAAVGNVNAIFTGAGCPPACPGTTAMRLWVVTYYLDLPPGADNVRYTADDGAPRLMRQVNGQPPVPVAENIHGLSFSYDTFDDVAGTLQSNIPDVIAVGQSPNQIRKVNVTISARSPESTGNFQNMQLSTSISARNMSFRDRYQ